MINKLLLQSVINKYYLSENESVKWIIKDKSISIDFMSPSKEVIGNISHSDFKTNDCTLAIFNTKKLLTLINITSGDLNLETESIKSTHTKFHISV